MTNVIDSVLFLSLNSHWPALVIQPALQRFMKIISGQRLLPIMRAARHSLAPRDRIISCLLRGVMRLIWPLA